MTALPCDGRAGDLGAEPDVEPLLLQMAQRFLRDLLIGHRRETCRAPPSITTSEPSRRQTLPSSRPMTPAPMTPRRFGTSLNVERARRVDDALAVELRNRQLDRHRARREHDVLRCEHLDAGVRRDLDAIAGEQLAAAFEARDAAGLEHRLDAGRELLDDAALAHLHRLDVDAEPADVNAVRLELRVRAVIELGGLEQRLRRNAADVQAGAAEQARALLVLPVVDAGGRQTELRGAQRGRIAGRTAADDDDVEVLVVHCLTQIG